MKMRCWFCFLAWALIISVGSAHGGTILSHHGAANPESEGWEPEQGIGTSVTTVGPIFNDEAHDAWFISDNIRSAGGSSDGYWGSLTAEEKTIADAQGWRFGSRLRVAEMSDDSFGSVAIYYFDGTKQWLLDFGSSETGDQIVTAVNGADFTGIDYNTHSMGYHHFEMIYDPNADTADVFVDGVERISDWTGILNPIQAGRFKFGSASSPDDGQGNYNMVEYKVVPIPSSLLLLLTGGLSVLSIRRKVRLLPFKRAKDQA
jgi:hypothetical protein